MDTEFVNAYIEKMKVTLDDFLAKNLILETQLQLTQKRALQLQEELETTKKQLNEVTIKISAKEKKEKKVEENTF